MTDSRAAERCPSRADLLCAIEGELTAEERIPLLSHLRRCADCRRSVDEIEGYVELVAAHIEHSFDADRVRARFQDFLQRLHRQKQAFIHLSGAWRSHMRWLPLATVIPVLIVAFVLTSRQEIVRADELVTRAATTERARAADTVQRIRITVTPASGAHARDTSTAYRLSEMMRVRDIRAVAASDMRPRGATPSDNEAALDQLLAASHFDLRQPLSVTAFEAWRASLVDKQDRVTTNGDLLLVLHTRTSEGALREAFLTVRRDTFHVVGLTLVFEGIGRVDIEEVVAPHREAAPSIATAPTTTSASASGSTLAPARTPPPSTPVAKAANEPTTVSRPDLSVWRARTFGNGPAASSFVPELNRLISSVKTRVRTLRELAKQEGGAPADEGASGSRATVQQQADESYAALCEDLEQLNTQVSLLFGSRDRVLVAEQTPTDWARRANNAVQHAEALERSVQELLTHEDLPSKAFGPKSRHPVIVTFSRLWDTISAPDGKPHDE